MRTVISLLLASAVTASATVVIDYVTVGDAGNAADPATGYGAVAYTYDIARNETTAAQYAEFLNATAESDPYGLYDTAMANSSSSGVVRSGVSGSYTYSVISGSENKPITYVSWFDAARFVNWLSNGQASGSTETGVYNLNGATSGIFMALQGSSVWLPTDDEWYKAAYYDPTKNGGMGGYWAYATESDALTSNTIGVAGAANFYNGNYARIQNGLSSYLTDVGAYGVNSASHYGTNDQTGNVFEWDDAVIGSHRGLRGGSWINTVGAARSSFLNDFNPSEEDGGVGFRVASSVPEPGAWILVVISGALCVRRRRR